MKIGPVGGSGPGGVADWQTARTAKLPRAGRLGVFLITAKLPWRFGTADGYGKLSNLLAIYPYRYTNIGVYIDVYNLK